MLRRFRVVDADEPLNDRSGSEYPSKDAVADYDTKLQSRVSLPWRWTVLVWVGSTLRSKNLSRDRSKYGRDCIDEQVYDRLVSAKSGSRGAKWYCQRSLILTTSSRVLTVATLARSWTATNNTKPRCGSGRSCESLSRGIWRCNECREWTWATWRWSHIEGAMMFLERWCESTNETRQR